jgi:hypothetical protein
MGEPAELAHDRGQRGRHDGLVKRRQQQRQEQRAEDGPDRWVVGLGHRCSQCLAVPMIK